MASKNDEFKILIASDCHLGHNEKDPIRGNDSFRTFEEVLKAAVRLDVDFILLAGDLFDKNKPSIKTIERTMSLIRKYCFGGDGKQKFLVKNFKNANCIDPNLRVKYPIFTIHGNHDNPIGIDCSCCLDVLSVSGLINYFGKQDNVEELLLKPIIFEKNQSKIMLYGFGSIREERLQALIENERFNFMTPDFDDSQEQQLQHYFKILLIHQNRVPRPGTKHVSPYDLTSLPDFVIWGHEHQPFKEPEYFEPNKFFILQPGSTVATSLCDAEIGDKYYYLMNCNFGNNRKKPKFKIESFRLETIRPFLMNTIDVDAVLSSRKKSSLFKSKVEEQEFLFAYCKNQIDRMINEACINNNEEKPLIRLRIDYSDKNQLFDIRKLGFHVNKLIANNNNDVVRVRQKRNEHNSNVDDVDDIDDAYGNIDPISATIAAKKHDVKTVLLEYFNNNNNDPKKSLKILDEKFLIEKLNLFVNKSQTSDYFKDCIENTKQAMRFSINEHSSTTKNEDETINEQQIVDSIRYLKEKISNDLDYRQKLQWIVQEPYVERPINLLAKKFKNLNTLNNQKSNNKNNTDESDPFYDDDINMMAIDDDESNSSSEKQEEQKRPPIKKKRKNNNEIINIM